MPKVTYKNLYSMVQEQIDTAQKYVSVSKYTQQTGRSSLMPLTLANTNSNLTDISLSNLVNSIQEVLSETIPPYIASGLTVEATSIPSNTVIVKSGYGSVGGTYYELTSDTTLSIPFSLDTQVWWIMLWKNSISVEDKKDPQKLPIAKIVIPQAGKADRVVNQRVEGSWDAYIVNLTEYKLFGDGYGNLEEDSVDILKDNIGDILANNVIGNLTLSENLKIINTDGSLEMDSNSINMLSANGVTLAKFNRKGTFFYDDDGVELAKFSTDGARVGNILVTKSSLESGNFVSGYNGRGFKIEDNGDAEFSNVIVRGELRSSVFLKDEIHISGGDLLVTNGTILDDNVSSTDTTITVKQAVFSNDDIIYLKNSNQSEHMKVISGGGTTTLTVTRNFDGESGTSASSWTKGEPVVEWGDRVAIVTSGDSASYTPYIDIIDRYSQDAVTCECTYARLGNLSGITDTNFGGALSGFGLYTTNAYLTGCLYAPCISTSNSGSRAILNTECFYAYDCSDNKIFQMIYGGDDAGDVILGNTSSQYIKWDNSESNFKIVSDNGTNCVEIQDGTVRANEMYLISPTCNCFYSYLTAGQWYFHDNLGNSTPYPKRICNGIGNAGDTIVLCGWCSEPKIQVGIKEIATYDGSYDGFTQKLCVYHDNVSWFCTSASCYGYCFDIHASLVKSAGEYAECIEDVNFLTSICTHSDATYTRTRLAFQVWKLECASSSCYYYGTICYKIRYRCSESGCAWCETSEFTYSQPNASVGDLKNTNYCCHAIEFSGGAGEYEIQACETGSSWTLTTLDATSTAICCRTFTGNEFHLTCGSPPANTVISKCCARTLSGSQPDNVYCVYLCYCWDTVPGAVQICQAQSSSISHIRICSIDCTIDSCSATTNFGTVTCTWSLESVCFDLTPSMASCSFSSIDLYAYICGSGSGTTYNAVVCLHDGYLIQCYGSVAADATCCLTKLYSTTDCSACLEVIDALGVLNYLAVGYN